MRTMVTKPTLITLNICLIMLSCLSIATAQTTDTNAKEEKNHPNVVKLNISAPILYNNAIMGSYERVLSPKRSVSIFGGYCELPGISIISNNENLKILNNKQKSGFSIGADYRFYLGKENKYPAPRGVYIAPYMSYYSFTNTRNILYDTGGTSQKPVLEAKLGVKLFNIGASLGYQFVIKKRFVLDMVMFGPSFTAYKFTAKIDGSGIDPDDLTQGQIDIINTIKEKFPFLGDVASDGGVSTSGVSQFGALGFRYSISIGYRF